LHAAEKLTGCSISKMWIHKQAEETKAKAQKLGEEASFLEGVLSREETANARQNRLRKDHAVALSKLEVSYAVAATGVTHFKKQCTL
jgi:hypothetical protein